MKKFIPLILVEFYLIVTLLIFFNGPIDFNIRNYWQFIIMIILYHASFLVGYMIALGKRINKNKVNIDLFSKNVYWLLFFIGLIGVFGTYNNLMLSETIIPYDFFKNLFRGLSEPGLAYADRMLAMERGVTSDSRVFNIFSIFFSFTKLFFIFYFMYYWPQMPFGYRVAAIFYSFLFISSGISAGVNSVIFLFAIFSIFSILTILYIKESPAFRRVLIISSILFMLPISSFGYIMSQRGGGFEYFASTSPLGDISVATTFQLSDESTIFDFLYYSFVWLDYYVTQGYYGFSLILDLDWNWTYGFGNSAFLQRQFLLLSGTDISKLTYQSRISQYWDESAQWHSFYGQFANDFGLYGMMVFLFILGYFFARVWRDVVGRNSFYGAALIPIFTIMFIFFPANNQVFAYIDMLSYFIFISIFWFFEGRKVRL